MQKWARQWEKWSQKKDRCTTASKPIPCMGGVHAAAKACKGISQKHATMRNAGILPMRIEQCSLRQWPMTRKANRMRESGQCSVHMVVRG